MDIYGDGFSVEEIKSDDFCDGFTSNPSLMKKLGVVDYLDYCKKLASCTELPVSLEVLSDDLQEMEREAMVLADCGENVFVKIPITNSMGHCTIDLICKLLDKGVNVNVTAVFTYKQIVNLLGYLFSETSGQMIISIFAGRIADFGSDPIPKIKFAKELSSVFAEKHVSILWASTRELYNIKQARDAGADIITVPSAMIKKLSNWNIESLEEYSLETVRMFKKDAEDCKYEI